VSGRLLQSVADRAHQPVDLRDPFHQPLALQHLQCRQSRDHYAAVFEQQGRIRALAPQRLRYDCRFVSVLRRSRQPARAAQLFADCLRRAHEPA
jgi:hypothetical protein